MRLYTVLINFDDFTVGTHQVTTNTPFAALEDFILSSASLENYDRQAIIQTVRTLMVKTKLLIQVTDGFKGLWFINFAEEIPAPINEPAILGGQIIQTDSDGSCIPQA